MHGKHHVLWRRYDLPGHDACRIQQSQDGWIVEGSAVFSDAGLVSAIRYCVTCDLQWHAIRSETSGWHRNQPVCLHMEQSDGTWLVNGERAPDLQGLIDIDLGFTPATNTIPIRRMKMAGVTSCEVVSAWLDPDTWQIRPLLQQYAAGEDSRLAYAAPSLDFYADLHIDAFGVVVDYPGLWRSEAWVSS